MLGDALSFPRNDEDWVKTVVIGTVLLVVTQVFALLGLLIPLVGQMVALVVQLPLVGYTVRVLRASARGEERPPRFDDWGDLFVDGLKGVVVSIVYTIPVGVLMFALVVGGVFAAGFSSDPTGTTPATSGPPPEFGVAFLVLFGVAMLLGLSVAYLVPAAMANFAAHDDLGKAFALREVVGTAFTADYFVAALIAVVVGLILGFVGVLLSVLLVGLAVLFYTQVVTYYLLGRGYAKGRDSRGYPAPTRRAAQ